jgi:prepilin-type N-terminal cleavage/methylation domain-containing protein
MKFAPSKGHITTGHRAFTLIELLVVIAIIGILSSVVLASLNTARNKGADAAIKSNLANARAEAELYYDSNSNTYGPAADASPAVSGVCANTGLANQIGDSVAAAQAAGATTVGCYASAGKWAANANLKTTSTIFYCVDSTGYAGTTTLNTITDAACP